MAAISGKQVRLGLNIATTWGTEVAVTDLFAVDSFSAGKSVTALDSSPIGLDQSMLSAQQRGAEDIRPSLSAKLGYQSNHEFMIAQFMGTAGAPTEQTAGQGDYLHEITFNSTLNSKLLTLAVKDTSGTTLAYPSASVTDLSISIGNPPNFIDSTFNLIANELELSSSTNTSSVLDGLTAPSSNPIIVDQADEFLINTQSGSALASPTDRVAIKSFELNLSRPQISEPEIKGSAWNSQPVDDGLFSGTVTIELKNKADHTYLTAADAGTEYKCSITMEGAQIGTGLNYQFKLLIPRMKIIEQPSHDITETGFNPLTITFNCLVASSNPSGMTSTYPYFNYINTRSTSLLA